MATTETSNSAAGQPAQVTHPLDPLTLEEITAAIEIIRSHHQLSERARFPTVALHEPSKGVVLNFREGQPIRREAEVGVLDKGTGATYEAIVSLNDNTLASWRQMPAVQPPVLMEEWDEAEQLIKEDPVWQEGARKRGVTNFEYVMVDPVSAGYFGFPHEEGKRLVRGVAYYRDGPNDNGYAHPLEGLIGIVDLNEKKVLEVWDDGDIPVPPQHGNFSPAAAGRMRTDLKPLTIEQPDGPSFAVHGHEVHWQKWRFRVSLHPRVGLVLHTVSYEDNGRQRPVLYRAALSEMVVPYGDPSRAHFWKGVFDSGEYGLGKMANSLERGCDCLGEIYYFDAVLGDERGNPATIKNVICMHEEDVGILWKHFDARSGETEVRRNRRLVVSYICTVGNYDYAFYWYFYQDGTIEHEIKATGIMQTQAVRPGQSPRYGTLVAPQLGAMYHQHFFNYRLDMMVDGLQNSVEEVNMEPLPMGPENPYGNAMKRTVKVFTRESEARSDMNVASARFWRIVNPSMKNGLGQPTAYRLLPGWGGTTGGNTSLLVHPDSWLARRAAFATHHVWVTKFDPQERYSAGNYPNQQPPDKGGILKWQADDASLENEDIVVWYTVGETHVPRPEDWPLTNVERIGFTLKPDGFFGRNPALDVPPPHPHCSAHRGDQTMQSREKQA